MVKGLNSIRLGPGLARHGGQRPGQVTMTLALALGVVALIAVLLQQGPIRPPWRSQVPPLATGTVTVGDVPVTVELAVAPAEQARGLGYRAGLEPGTGMLFVNDESSIRTFWMKGMRFCIDIVWIEGGQVVGAAESVCPAPPGTADAEQPRYRSPVPVRYVLEVPAGWLDANGLGVGSPVTISLPEGAAA